MKYGTFIKIHRKGMGGVEIKNDFSDDSKKSLTLILPFFNVSSPFLGSPDG